MGWQGVGEGLVSQFSDLSDAAGATRLAACLLEAAVLGALLGWERTAAGKSAGLRTHMLVCVGAAFLAAVPAQAGLDSAAVSRVLQGLTAGVGFLGAGAILKREEAGRITGLTTAAGLWLTSGVGIAAGMGLGLSAAGCAALALGILWLLRRLEYGGTKD
jgi:putative Mg2+ transporter-C (MgtC) family protein